MVSEYREYSRDGIGKIHKPKNFRYNRLPERVASFVSFGRPVPHVPEVPLHEGVEIPLRYDRSHLDIDHRLVVSVGEDRPLPIREVVIVSLQQHAWREFFGRILHQSEAPLQNSG